MSIFPVVAFHPAPGPRALLNQSRHKTHRRCYGAQIALMTGSLFQPLRPPHSTLAFGVRTRLHAPLRVDGNYGLTGDSGNSPIAISLDWKRPKLPENGAKVRVYGPGWRREKTVAGAAQRRCGAWTSRPSWQRPSCGATPDSIVVPFDTQAFDAKVDPSDSILSLADRLAKFGGGGTDCSLPIRKANANYPKRKFAGVVLVSDNESWVYGGRPYLGGANGSTGVMTEWQQFVRNQVRLQGGEFTGPRLICIDLQAYQTTQAPERSDTLNVGGFSDAVFDVIATFLTSDAGRFVAEIEAVTL